MYNVFLDTNIYRSLGLRFVKHRDFVYLIMFLRLAYHDFGLVGLVRDELFDYYQKDVFGKLFSEHLRLVREYKENPYLRKLPAPDIQAELAEAMRMLTIDVEFPGMLLEVDHIPATLLTKFLLFNKAERRGDNARDFILFYNLLVLGEDKPDEQVVLISNDKIFRTNEFFLELQRERKVVNLVVYESIAAFMAVAGPQVSWMTLQIVYAAIDPAVIYNELLADVICLPSYISDYYYQRDGDDIPPVEKLEIENYRVGNFYIHPDEKGKKLLLSAEVRVSVYALFGRDPDPEALERFFSQHRVPTIDKPETFDAKGRVVFDEDILFLFEGTVNEKKNKLDNFHFIDFMPDYYRADDWVPGPAYKVITLDK